MKRKVSILLVVTIVLTMFITACGTSKENDTVEETPKATTDTPATTDTTDTTEKDSNEPEMVGNMYKTGLPIVEDKVTLKVAVYRANHVGAFAEMQLMKQIEEMTNVQIDWIEYSPDSVKEKVNIMLASEDYPDIAWGFVLGKEQISNYAQAGAIVNLKPLIEEYAPNWLEVFEKYPYVKKLVTEPNGEIYSLPFIRMDEASSGMRDAWLINKTWLDKLDLEVPETTEEFRQVLKAFKEKDPNGNGQADEIPWTFMYNTYANGYYDIFGSFGILHGAYTDNLNIGIQDGKVIFTAVQPEVKEALKYLNSLYQEGLIDMESFTQNGTTWNAKLASELEIVGSTSVFTGAGATQFGLERMENEVYVAMPPLIGPNGETPKWRQQTNAVQTGFFTIFDTNEYPEISMRWANELADEIISLQSFYGIEGTHIKKTADGQYDIDNAIYGERGQFVPLNFGPFVLTPEMTSSIKQTGGPALRLKFYNMYKPYVAPLEEIYPPVSFNEEQLDILGRYNLDLTEYVRDAHAKFIVEGGIDEGWDAFVNKVNDLKVEEVLKVYQQALDDFNKK